MPLRRPLPKLIVLEGQQVHMRGQNGAKGDVGGRTGRWVDVALDYEDGPRGTQVVAVLQRRVARVVGAVWPKLRGLAVLPQQLHPDEFRPAHILDEGGSQLADLAFLGDAHLHEVALPQLPHGNEDLALRQLRSRARLHRQLQGHAGVRRKHDAHPELGAIDHHPCRLVAVALVAVQTHPILVAAGDKHACTWLPRAQNNELFRGSARTATNFLATTRQISLASETATIDDGADGKESASMDACWPSSAEALICCAKAVRVPAQPSQPPLQRHRRGR
eukprot:CAMPEP_0170245264 /NCGR_PEP_ID=MMETSP0116_2-20130129/22416_1 /TAXON_ID=400756 /ORGANISM="Durinskia baltica, Strain CSIRO CS-38" /LENGTH=276 /DNA_ID=CAMNT_0010496135 /DNA_START=106 /DNA_END=937 /DNA_ORIENTATION=-